MPSLDQIGQQGRGDIPPVMRAIAMPNLHMLSGPRKLAAHKSNEFDAYVAPYSRHIEPLIQSFDEEDARSANDLPKPP